VFYFLQCKAFTSMNTGWKPIFVFITPHAAKLVFLSGAACCELVRREAKYRGTLLLQSPKWPNKNGLYWASTPFILSREFLNEPVYTLSTSPICEASLSQKKKKERKKRRENKQTQSSKRSYNTASSSQPTAIHAGVTSAACRSLMLRTQSQPQ